MEPAGTVASFFRTNGGNQVLNLPDLQRVAYAQCFTPAYTAGANEVALIHAGMGAGPFPSDVQMDFLTMYTVNGGAPTDIGDGQFVVGRSGHLTALGRLELTQARSTFPD